METADTAARARRIAELAARRLTFAAVDAAARDRARQLDEHVRTYIVPRITSLDAPLVIVLIGPTGAGKSSLMNALAGASVSAAGVLRPTTRDVVVLASAADAQALRATSLSAVPADRLRVVDTNARPGVALVDAPDIDSVERTNRALADALVEAADLCIFVTTAARYADQVPWDVLERARQRGLPLLFVANRLPRDSADRDDVVTDLVRLLADRGIDVTGGGAHAVVPIVEGDIDPAGQALTATAAAPLRARIDALPVDRDSRRELAERALAGAVAGLAPLLSAVAGDVEREAADADALRSASAAAYDGALAELRDELRGGRFMREEVLRQWQSFVNADQVTRFFSSGIGRLRGAIVAAVRGTPIAPVGVVEQETTSDVTALAVSHASEAARRTAAAWSAMPAGAQVVSVEPALWTAAPSFAGDLEPRLHEWVSRIADDVRARGAAKRTFAFGASLGVNVVGIAVMLGVFAHTAGLTGAEVGVAAATGFLNQKLLQALFGEAAMNEMIGHAREDLDRVLADRFVADRARFDDRVADPAAARGLAAELRASITAQ